MTIFNDGNGHYYLGNCIYIQSPTNEYLTAYPHSDISAELTALYTAAGLSLDDPVSPQSDFDAFNAVSLGFWKDITGNDPNAGFTRMGMFVPDQFWSGASTVSPQWAVAKDSVTAALDFNDFWFSEEIIINPEQSLGISVSNILNTSGIQWAGVADNESIALAMYGKDLTNPANPPVLGFLYMGKLDFINDGLGYYTSNYLNQIVGVYIRNRVDLNNGAEGLHIENFASKSLLQTGEGDFPIDCIGGTPTGNISVFAFVYDNLPLNGDPIIGVLRNCLLAEGSFTLGKPVNIIGANTPGGLDPGWAGSNNWLPVGTYAGKTLLMRCWSQP